MTLRETIRWHYKNTPWFRSAVRKTKDAALYGAVRLGFGFIRLLPLNLALWLADRVGALLYSLLTELRELSQKHLELAFGDSMSAAERERIGRAATMHQARSLVEIAKFDAIRPRLKEYIQAVRPELIVEASNGPTAAIVVTGHCGNWELLAAYFGLLGCDIAAVARRFYVPKVNDLLVGFRASNGVESVLRDASNSSARQILKVLKRGAVLAMVIDQDTHTQSISIPFFGQPARTPVAPVVLALRRNLPLMTAFIERLPEGGHRITIDPPLTLTRSGDELADIRAGLTQISEKLEEFIRRRPEQWVWWHKRWDRAPLDHLDLDAEFE